MSQIVLGKAVDEKSAAGARWRNVGLALPVLLRTHLLISSSTGGGKSWLIRRIAEQAFGKVPVIIVDREGEFPTLREKFGFVLVGQGGETPADVRSAKLVAEKLLELRASAVCDLYELKHETRHEWVKAFVNGLVDAPKRLWGPTLIVLDEAHLFCPEKGQGESPAYGAVADLAGVGRKRGFGIVLATQRLSKLSKNATGEMYNQAAGPTARQADRDRAAYEMGISDKKETKEFSEALRTLEPGSFFFQGRAISMDRLLVKIGPVETTHAQAGSAKYKATAPPLPEKVRSLLPKLKDLPQAAEEKARTEAEFKQEIRSLKAQLRGAQVATASNTPKVIEQKVADPRAIQEAVRKLDAQRRAELQQRDQAIKKLGGTLASLSANLAGMAKSTAAAAVVKLPELRAIEIKLPQPIRSPESAQRIHPERPVLRGAEGRSLPSRATEHEARGTPVEGVSQKQMAILRTLAEFEAIGRDTIPRTWVAARSGASHRSSAYTNNLGALRSAGMIDYGAGSTVRLTEEGRNLAPHVEAPLTTEEMLESCLRIVSQKQGAILKELHSIYPSPATREELAHRAGASPNSSAYTNNLGALRSAGMIDYLPGSTVKCADWLFID